MSNAMLNIRQMTLIRSLTTGLTHSPRLNAKHSEQNFQHNTLKYFSHFSQKTGFNISCIIIVSN